jgi:zinc protease
MRFLLLMLLSLTPVLSQAVNIEKVISPKLGIEAWLVQSHQLPMVNVHVSFKVGSIHDGEKNGVSSLTASLIPEGSGQMNAEEFTQEIEKMGAMFSATPHRLKSTFSMRMLSEHKQTSFALLGQAVSQPHFDTDAFERVRDAVKTSILAGQQNPSHVGSLLLQKHFYEGHPYGRPVTGTFESVEQLTPFDVKRFYDQNYHLKNMVVSVVGDITAEELGTYLDTIFIDLKPGEKANDLPSVPSQHLPLMIRQEMNVPQSTVYLAHAGITRQDPRYYAVFVMNYVLGGGGFNSRLMEEIREKRGLAYGVYSYLEILPNTGSFRASVSTKNEDVMQSIALIKSEMARFKREGTNQKEYDGAISYLKGSFPLRLDSSSKILGYLDTMQLENLGVEYLDMWTKHIEKVTKEDVERVAKELLREDHLMTVIVGGEPAH